MPNTLTYSQQEIVDMLRRALQIEGHKLVGASVKVDMVVLADGSGSTIIFQGIEVVIEKC